MRIFPRSLPHKVAIVLIFFTLLQTQDCKALPAKCRKKKGIFFDHSSSGCYTAPRGDFFLNSNPLLHSFFCPFGVGFVPLSEITRRNNWAVENACLRITKWCRSKALLEVLYEPLPLTPFFFFYDVFCN